MAQREDRYVGNSREMCEDITSFIGLGLFGSDDPVPVVCEYTHCPHDGKDHRTLCCLDMCPYRVYFPEPKIEHKPSE